jgi:hypothetical protein
MLKHGPVNDGQHFFWNGFGGRQHASAKTGDGKYSFANALGHENSISGVLGHALLRTRDLELRVCGRIAT